MMALGMTEDEMDIEDRADVTVGGDLEELIEYLRLYRGVDFGGFKRNTLERRIRRRMSSVGVDGFGDYQGYLEAHPDEFTALFDTTLTKVTEFFRDPAAWKVIAERVVPHIVKGKADDRSIRVWCAACSTGQEAYTLAMVFADHLGNDEFRNRVKIYATDVDETALSSARAAEYTAREVQSVPDDVRDRYFEKHADGTFQFSKELRRSVIFGRHDVLHDAPISRVDLVTCRNTLIYFNFEAQLQILERLHFSVAPHGYLFLGRAERLINHTSLFEAADARARVFVKTSSAAHDAAATAPAVQLGPVDAPAVEQLVGAAFDSVPSALVLVDMNGEVIRFNAAAGTGFDMSASDVGRPLRELELPVRSSELRSALREATRDHQPVQIADVEHRRSDEPMRRYEVTFLPVSSNDRDVVGALLCFDEVTAFRHIQEELEDANRDIELACEELQSTNEELETTNEELQSTVEELETTNEELQTTNEELETMNEELHSANDELQSTNEELRVRTNELNHVNSFMRSVLGSLAQAVVVVDRDLRVLVWSEPASELWGLREQETLGRGLLSLDFGLPLDDVVPLVRSILRGDRIREQVDIGATNRRGRKFTCRVTLTRMFEPTLDLLGVVVLMDVANA
jgi:two-component system, chemotaxis family, CheB/CheR fusion protein